MKPGHTIALLGSSGVGKSPLINRLYGQDVQHTSDIRTADGRGKHTTTHRELILLPNGGLLIDTPGMRELQLWDADEGLSLQQGTLNQSRYSNYLKLQKELAYQLRKDDKQLQAEEKEKWKNIHKGAKQLKHR